MASAEPPFKVGNKVTLKDIPSKFVFDIDGTYVKVNGLRGKIKKIDETGMYDVEIRISSGTPQKISIFTFEVFLENLEHAPNAYSGPVINTLNPVSDKNSVKPSNSIPSISGNVVKINPLVASSAPKASAAAVSAVSVSAAPKASAAVSASAVPKASAAPSAAPSGTANPLLAALKKKGGRRKRSTKRNKRNRKTKRRLNIF
jgi:hypothetical protein